MKKEQQSKREGLKVSKKKEMRHTFHEFMESTSLEFNLITFIGVIVSLKKFSSTSKL